MLQMLDDPKDKWTAPAEQNHQNKYIHKVSTRHFSKFKISKREMPENSDLNW